MADRESSTGGVRVSREQADVENRAAFMAQLKAQLAVLHDVASAATKKGSLSPQHAKELSEELLSWFEVVGKSSGAAETSISVFDLVMMLRKRIFECTSPTASTESGKLVTGAYSVAHLCAVRCWSAVSFQLPLVLRTPTADGISEDSIRLFKDAVAGLNCAFDIFIDFSPPVSIALLATPSWGSSTAKFVVKCCVEATRQFAAVSVAAATRCLRLAQTRLSSPRGASPAGGLRAAHEESAALMADPSFRGQLIDERVMESLSLLGSFIVRPLQFLLTVLSRLTDRSTSNAAVVALRADINNALFQFVEILSTPSERSIVTASDCVAGLLFPSPCVVAIKIFAQRAGDDDDGQLLALRLLGDVLDGMDREFLRHAVTDSTTRKLVIEGLLGSVVSPHVHVVKGALCCVKALVSAAPAETSQEISIFYSRVVLRLLEPDRAAHDIKCAVIKHLVDTLVSPAQDPNRPPMVLTALRVFDLAPALQHGTVVSAFVSALDRIATSPIGSDRNRVQEQYALYHLAVQALVQLVGTLSACVGRTVEGDEGSSKLQQLQKEKSDLSAALEMINENPVKGMKKFFKITDEEMQQNVPESGKSLEVKDVPPCPEQLAEKMNSVVDFLMFTPAVTMETVGEFISDNRLFPLQCCRELLSRLVFRHKSLPEALMSFLSVVALPKEGQRIERLLEFVAAAYFDSNVTLDGFPFANADATFVTTVAVVMLNTDLHNPRVATKMNLQSFEGQLRGCNDGKNFPQGFAAGIYDAISKRPLSTAKTRADAVAAPPIGGGRMDMLFFTSDERREVLLGLERQTLINDTRVMLERRSRTLFTDEIVKEALIADDTLAKDLFRSRWHVLHSIFALGIQEPVTGTTDETMKNCVDGLRQCLACAVGFSLREEAERTMTALIHASGVRVMTMPAIKAILSLVSSPLAVHFSPSCWSAAIGVLTDTRRGSSTAADGASETAWYNIVSLVRDAEVSGDVSKMATFFEGLEQGLCSVPAGDGLTLGGYCAALRRVLVFSLPNGARAVNTFALSNWVRRVFVQLANFHAKSDECLHILMECLTTTLTESWIAAHETRRYSAENLPPNYFDVLLRVYDCTRSDGQSSMDETHQPRVKLHVLESIRAMGLELVTNARIPRGGAHTFSFERDVWTIIIHIVVKALHEASTVGTEVCSAGLTALRSLTTAACDPSAPYWATSAEITHIVLSRLSDAAFIGTMCSDVGTARTAIVQLHTIVTATLNSPVSSLMNGKHTATGAESSRLAGAKIAGESVSVSVASSAVVMIVLCLQSEKDPIRADAIQLLRGLLVQLHQPQICTCAAVMADVMSRAMLGKGGSSRYYHHVAEGDQQPPISNGYLEAFSRLLFKVSAEPGDTPPNVIKLCSKGAFYTSLPACLDVLVRDVLGVLTADQLLPAAQSVVQSLLLPIVTAGPVISITARTLCARFLSEALVLAAQHSTPGTAQFVSSSVAELTASLLGAAYEERFADDSPLSTFVRTCHERHAPESDDPATLADDSPAVFYSAISIVFSALPKMIVGYFDAESADLFDAVVFSAVDTAMERVRHRHRRPSVLGGAHAPTSVASIFRGGCLGRLLAAIYSSNWGAVHRISIFILNVAADDALGDNAVFGASVDLTVVQWWDACHSALDGCWQVLRSPDVFEAVTQSLPTSGSSDTHANIHHSHAARIPAIRSYFSVFSDRELRTRST